jgi:hypothetical protein
MEAGGQRFDHRLHDVSLSHQEQVDPMLLDQPKLLLDQTFPGPFGSRFRDAPGALRIPVANRRPPRGTG